MSEPQAAVFQIEKVYVKDVSLEIPHAPQVFMEQAEPKLDVRVDTGAQQFAEGLYEVTVSATVTLKAGEKTLFLAEAVQGGIFQLRNIPPEELAAVLGVACPTVLYPYLREVISDLITRGGFPPVLLTPISFEQIYLQRLQAPAGEPPTPPDDGPRIEVAR